VLISKLNPAALARRKVNLVISKDNNLGARGLRGVIIKKKSKI
jgi:hypothetical protein